MFGCGGTDTFVEGTAVALTDVVIVTVDVSKVGTWSYNTGTQEGLSFTGSGSFTATGSQEIVLQAVGKPAKAGTFTFPLIVGSVTCSFSVTVNIPGGNNPAPGVPYYKATIAGVNYMESVTATNDYEAGSILAGNDDVVLGAGINYFTTPIPAGFTTMGIDKGVMHGYLTSTEAQFKAFFPVSLHPFTPPGPDNNPHLNGDGIVIYWTDKQGNHWSSSSSTQAQPASSIFKIVSVEDALNLTGTYFLKVKMEFNCILYKAGTTETATLTNGEMLAYFGKI
ncbi:hypothetical protein [Paraflavitalea speifideaquila]|uniref:hypothetical protein n=1 Tax=Paraflavitalea speifideaquila TaxID=3076558 RepID=UPI0028EB3B6F|nr:hypothetical protein [Paraflavitalea speifideiaquila]